MCMLRCYVSVVVYNHDRAQGLIMLMRVLLALVLGVAYASAYDVVLRVCVGHFPDPVSRPGGKIFLQRVLNVFATFYNSISDFLQFHAMKHLKYRGAGISRSDPTRTATTPKKKNRTGGLSRF